MKTRLASLLACAGLLAGCVTTRPPETPHTAAIAGNLETARSSTASAQAAAAKVGSGLSRIDAKATVILRWLNQHPTAP